jgi:hypothetical protein
MRATFAARVVGPSDLRNGSPTVDVPAVLVGPVSTMNDPVVITGWVIVVGSLIFLARWLSPAQRSRRRRADARARVAFRRALRSDGRDRHAPQDNTGTAGEDLTRPSPCVTQHDKPQG